MKQIFVTDLDGTLLGSDSRVTPRSASIISSLTRDGALITVATARTPATVEPLLRDTATALPAIVMTGAAFWHRDTMVYTHTRQLDASTALSIYTACHNAGICPFVYMPASDGTLDVLHDGTLSETDHTFVNDRLGLALKRFRLNTPYTGTESPFMLFALGPRHKVFALADTLRRRGDCSISAYVDIFGNDIGIIEIFAPGVSKASALLNLKAITGADHVTVYGDNLNDLPMMAIADESVAVGNALPEVKAAATRVIGPNTTDAVALDIARSLERFS